MKNFTEKLSQAEIWIWLVALFFASAFIAQFHPSLPKTNLRRHLFLLTGLIWFLGLGLYFLGTKLSDKLDKLGFLPLIFTFPLLTLAMKNFLEFSLTISIALNLLALISVGIFHRIEDQRLGKRFFLVSFSVGFSVLVFNLAVNGIPLFNPDLHFESVILNSLLLFSFYVMLYSATRSEKSKYLFPLLIFITFLTTHRTFMAIASITWFFLLLRKGERKKGLALLVVLGIAVVSLGGFLYQSRPNWTLNTVETAVFRPLYTMNVFRDIVKVSFPWGHGLGVFTQAYTARIAEILYSYSAQLTTTVFGPVMYDFGLLGVGVLMLFSGALLKKMEELDYEIYAILMASFVATIEKGFGPAALFLFIYVGYFKVWEETRYIWKRLREAV